MAVMPLTFAFNTPDGFSIVTSRWQPEGPVKGVIQIAHGMAEHVGRYEDVAQFLVGQGFAVYANDHRGHGQTAGTVAKLGYWGERDGWQLVVGDMIQLTSIIKDEHPGKPVFLLGHSLGSLLSRHYIMSNGKGLAGVILSGTGGDPGLLGIVGRYLATFISSLVGKATPSPLLDRLTFGEFNKAFKPVRTKSDWLSRDPKEVDKYIADPFCGTIFSAGFFVELLTGVGIVNGADNIKYVPKELPILVISGDQDPVGDFGKGVQKVVAAFEAAGSTDIELILYPGARHELFKETNREEVFRDVKRWLAKHL